LIWQINNRTNFSQTVTSGIGQDRIITEANSALTTSLTNKLAVQLNFSLRHVNKVPDSSTSRLTTTTSLNLVYNFV
jgi:putative salt-induced outer membrane protein YdiY